MMKSLQIFFLLLFFYGNAALVVAQCPASTSDESGATGSVFNYDLTSGTPTCASLGTGNITIGGASYAQNTCLDSDLANYVIDSGTPDPLPHTVDFGGSIGSCAYDAAGALRTVTCPGSVASPDGGMTYIFDISNTDAPLCDDLPNQINLVGTVFDNTSCIVMDNEVIYQDFTASFSSPLPFTVDFDGTIGTCSYTAAGILLPVEFIYFKGKEERNNVLLEWATATETNNSGFEIQYSSDGKNWKPIDFIEGQGASYDVYDYQYTHTQPVPGTNYYRLKQIDYDGVFSFSHIITVNIKDDSNHLLLSPNPAENGMVTVSIEQINFETGKLTLFDVMGRQVKTQNLSDNETSLAINDLPEGMYIVEVLIGGKRLLERLMVK